MTSLALVTKLATRFSHFHYHIALDCHIGIISMYWVGSLTLFFDNLLSPVTKIFDVTNILDNLMPVSPEAIEDCRMQRPAHRPTESERWVVTERQILTVVKNSNEIPCITWFSYEFEMREWLQCRNSKMEICQRRKCSVRMMMIIKRLL